MSWKVQPETRLRPFGEFRDDLSTLSRGDPEGKPFLPALSVQVS